MILQEKLGKKIAKLQSMIARTIANMGKQQEEEQPVEEVQVADDVKGLF